MQKTTIETRWVTPLSAVEECQQVVRVANPALATMGPVTYYPGFRVVGDRFSGWLHGTFQQQILPGLLQAVKWGSDGKGRELLETDSQVLADATPMLREGSARAGRLLLRQGVPTGVKALQKLEKAVLLGQAAGHLATVFGARCGIFSIGQRTAALAYVYLELRLGATDWHDLILQEKLADAAEVIENFLRKTSSLKYEDALSGEWRSHG